MRHTVGLSICGSVHLWLCPSVGLSVCGSVHLWVYPSVGLSVRGSVCPWAYPSVGLSICGSVCLWVCLSVGLSICGSIHLWVCPSVGLSICGSVHLWVYPYVGLSVPQLHQIKNKMFHSIHFLPQTTSHTSPVTRNSNEAHRKPLSITYPRSKPLYGTRRLAEVDWTGNCRKRWVFKQNAIWQTSRSNILKITLHSCHYSATVETANTK